LAPIKPECVFHELEMITISRGTKVVLFAQPLMCMLALKGCDPNFEVKCADFKKSLKWNSVF